jgi:hypothetical protein
MAWENRGQYSLDAVSAQEPKRISKRKNRDEWFAAAVAALHRRNPKESAKRQRSVNNARFAPHSDEHMAKMRAALRRKAAERTMPICEPARGIVGDGGEE